MFTHQKMFKNIAWKQKEINLLQSSFIYGIVKIA